MSLLARIRDSQQAGKIIDNYLLVQKERTAISGDVYKSIELSTGSPVHLHFSSPCSKSTLPDPCLESIAAMVAFSHPNVEEVVGFGTHISKDYVVIRPRNRSTLASRVTHINRRHIITIEELQKLFADMHRIADALDSAHAQEIYHHWLSTTVIGWDETGTPVLSGLGMSPLWNRTNRFFGRRSITQQPDKTEGLRGHGSGAKSDQYGLAYLLHSLCFDRVPFANQLSSTRSPYRRAEWGQHGGENSRDDFPPGIKQIFEQAMAPHATDRFPDCTTFIETLLAAFARV